LQAASTASACPFWSRSAPNRSAQGPLAQEGAPPPLLLEVAPPLELEVLDTAAPEPPEPDPPPLLEAAGSS
jgi:hypothetical protein